VDARFPPALRLHNDRDYSRVFNRQQKAAGPHLLLLLRPQQRTAAGAVPKPRIGIMVSTKTASKAVRRHQLKRWVRELFRLTLREQPQLQGWDIVVLFRRDPPQDGHQLLAREVLDLLPRALGAAPKPKGRERRA